MSRKWVCLVIVVLMVASVFLSTIPARAGQGSKWNKRILGKVTFIHFRKGHSKPPWACGGKGGGEKEDEGFYSYISNGARWKSPEDFLLNPACDENKDGSLDWLFKDAIVAGMTEWETPQKKELDIFEAVAVDSSVTYSDGDYRGYNTISFGEYKGDPNVIAVTTVWVALSDRIGPVSRRRSDA